MPFPDVEVRIVDPDDLDRAGAAGRARRAAGARAAGLHRLPRAARRDRGGLPRRVAPHRRHRHDGEDGFVTIVDRIKELIITGGFNVYPSEVEAALAAARRRPRRGGRGPARTEDGGEEVVAAVVLGRRASQSTPTQLRAHCRPTLAAYKVPRRVVVVDELPRSRSARCCAARSATSSWLQRVAHPVRATDPVEHVPPGRVADRDERVVEVR